MSVDVMRISGVSITVAGQLKNSDVAAILFVFHAQDPAVHHSTQFYAKLPVRRIASDTTGGGDFQVFPGKDITCDSTGDDHVRRVNVTLDTPALVDEKRSRDSFIGCYVPRDRAADV